MRLDEDGAIAAVRWICRRPTGAAIWDFSDTYVVVRADEGWQILGDIVHDAE